MDNNFYRWMMQNASPAEMLALMAPQSRFQGGGLFWNPDYNYRAAASSNLTPANNGHFNDIYKLPNHPSYSTFSEGGLSNPLAGTWDGGLYLPSMAGLRSGKVPLFEGLQTQGN